MLNRCRIRANGLDESAYQLGLGESVPLTDESVRTTAAEYLADTPVPALGGSVTITVESRARADLAGP
jgi:hypothetical protein